jgi:GPH family glycoside/pentoside/hexuronide:cation symporter
MALSAKLRHGYGVAGLSIAVADTSTRIFLFKFLIDEAKLSPATAGTVLLVGKLWDAINDPLVGYLSDRTSTSMGARRPWIAGALVPFIISFSLIWRDLPGEGFWKAAFYVLLLLLYDTMLTALVVPYNSLAQTLTENYDERTKLNGTRFFWGVFGALLTAAGMPLLAERFGWAKAGTFYAIAAAFPWIIMLITTRGLDPGRPQEEGFALRAVLKNRAFRRTLVLCVTAWPCVAIISSLIPFYVQHYIGHPEALKIGLGTMQLSTIIMIPVVVRISQKLQKPRAYAMGVLTWAFVVFLLALIPAGQKPFFFVLTSLMGFGVASTYVLLLAMVPDVTETDVTESGVPRVGVFYGVMNFLVKLSTSFALWAISLVLEFSGYQEGAAVQPESAIFALRILIGPIPAVILLFSAFYAWRYPPLTREEHAAIVAKQQGKPRAINNPF